MSSPIREQSFKLTPTQSSELNSTVTQASSIAAAPNPSIKRRSNGIALGPCCARCHHALQGHSSTAFCQMCSVSPAVVSAPDWRARLLGTKPAKP